IGVDQGIVKKSGAFYSYGDTKLGQGRENSKEFLIQHPEIAASVEGRIRGPNGTGNIEEGDPLSNGNAPHVENSVADILSGNTSLELEDDEE
ncbi:MAG TPA: DNA recombination/repair protein RecA, partial [Dehalococcoidia bacterium]|nr:DNA recombination/repair protein RecA [Dehalococcoidia bacterium]